MKKSVVLKVFILAVAMVISMAAMTGCESIFGASEGLVFTSNGDGTCYVSDYDYVIYETTGIEFIDQILVGTVIIPELSPSGERVVGIGDMAFAGCLSLTSVTIPDSVTSIGNMAFGYCTSLTSVTIGDNVSSIGMKAFIGCSSIKRITIPDSVTKMGYFAFKDCTSLTICCEAKREPDGWRDWWNPDNRFVVWGYNK